MGFLGHRGGSEAEKLIRDLSFEGKSPAETWSTRRDAAAKLGGLADREAVAPLCAGMNAAVTKMRSRHAELSRAELECLLGWRLNPLVHHTDEEWRSLTEKTGTAMTIVRIGEFEWAWAAALIHAEALSRLGERAAPQQLLSELRTLEGSQWQAAESILRTAGVF